MTDPYREYIVRRVFLDPGYIDEETLTPEKVLFFNILIRALMDALGKYDRELRPIDIKFLGKEEEEQRFPRRMARKYILEEPEYDYFFSFNNVCEYLFDNHADGAKERIRQEVRNTDQRKVHLIRVIPQKKTSDPHSLQNLAYA